MQIILAPFTDEQQMAMLDTIPHWHATIVGPFGSIITRDMILRGSGREVAHLMFSDAEEMDEAAGREHDPDQWKLVNVSTCNCN